MLWACAASVQLLREPDHRRESEKKTQNKTPNKSPFCGWVSFLCNQFPNQLIVQCTKTYTDKYKGTAVGDGERELNFELQTQNSAHMASPGCGANVCLTPVHCSSRTQTTVLE